MTCIMCGKPLKVQITGGDFLVRSGPLPKEINFDIAQSSLCDAGGKVINEVTAADILKITVTCSAEPSHPVLGTDAISIKVELCNRLIRQASQLINQYK